MEPQIDHFAEAERWLAIAEQRLLRFERDQADDTEDAADE